MILSNTDRITRVPLKNCSACLKAMVFAFLTVFATLSYATKGETVVAKPSVNEKMTIQQKLEKSRQLFKDNRLQFIEMQKVKVRAEAKKKIEKRSRKNQDLEQ